MKLPGRRRMPLALIEYLVQIHHAISTSKVRDQNVLLAKLERILRWSGSTWYVKKLASGELKERT